MATANMLGLSRKKAAFLSAVDTMADEVKNKMFSSMYREAVRRRVIEGDNSLFTFLTHLERAPVGIEEFIDSTEFLGATDFVLWPEVRQAIIDMNCKWWMGDKDGAYNSATLMGACVDADTEFLTPNGWKPISEYRPGDLVGQYHPNGKVTFVRPQRYVKYRANSFLHFNPRGGVDMALTEGHRVIYRHQSSGEILEISAEDLANKQSSLTYGFRGKFISTFSVEGRPGIGLSDPEIRVMVMVHADGSFYEDTEWCNVILKKERKISRAVKLLDDAGIEYSRIDRVDGYTRLRFYAPQRNKTYAGWFRCTEDQLRVVADEVINWDGSDLHKQFYTAKKEEADFIQYAFCATGTRATMQWQSRGGSRAIEYRVKRCKNSTTSLANSGNCVKEIVSQDGYCYCFTLETGMWVARRNGSVFVTGNTGTGKTSLAICTTMYHLYLLSCLANPQAVYGFPKATSIVFAIMGAKPRVVNKVIYIPMKKLIESMPYFQKYCMPSKLVESEMYFEEKNIRIAQAGGDEDAILGEAIIGGIIDEINFMNVVQRSKKAEVSTGRAGLYDQAQQVHSTMQRRKAGRFTRPGPMIGLVIASSSTKYRGDFTDRHKSFVEKNGIKNCFIYNRKQFEVVPPERFSGEKFKLVIGNDIYHDTRVLNDGEVMPAGAWIEEIPIEYKDQFLKTPYDALRDVLGISHNALAPFIKTRYKIYDCIEAGKEIGLESILVRDHVILGEHGMPQIKAGTYCANPSRPRYVHIDLSRNADRCGIAMIRFEGMREVQRSNGMKELLPVATVELSCSIAPDANNEIDVAEIRAFVKHLKTRYGFPIKGVSYDGVDSRESIQAWRKDGMRASMVSVDRTSVPYKQFRDAMYDTRVNLLDDPIVVEELLDLEYDEDKDKVDHSVNGSKDVSDAICGAYTNLLERKSTWANAADDDRAFEEANRAVFDQRFDEQRRT